MTAPLPQAPSPPPAPPRARAGGRGAAEAGCCPTPHPFSELLPAMFQDDEFVLRFVAGLDDVLAPALVALDCLWSYFDPLLTPVDFLEFLAGWVGLAAEQAWPEENRRALVLQAAELYRWQGTAAGLSAHLRICTGSEPEILDPGGVSWSQTPLGAFPGEEGGEIVVRVGGADAARLSELEEIVRMSKPAHVRHRVEVG